ncbi:MAG: hypothetical protein ABIJ18_01205 [archaeon]
MKLYNILSTIGVLIALTLSIVNIYNTYFVEEIPELTFQSMPLELSTVDIDNEIYFTFFLYNEGVKPAFVDYIDLGDIDAQVNPKKDFVINPGETKEVNVVFEAPGKSYSNEFQVRVYYGQGRVYSEIIPLNWG